MTAGESTASIAAVIEGLMETHGLSMLSIEAVQWYPGRELVWRATAGAGGQGTMDAWRVGNCVAESPDEALRRAIAHLDEQRATIATDKPGDA